ncbi:hypothetical protein [Longimicrobium sp.]|uniref:hypothetical protein n=1 Tax=Longimicrobium sp. TaxID=2029185 RepID=UPI003B3AF5F3
MQTMAARQIRLPDRFYLSRTDGSGREVHDVMPWEDAVAYATDGERVGIQYADGRVVWLGDASPAGDGAAAGMGSFAEDFEGVNLDALVSGLRAYVDRHPVLKSVWAEDLQQLDSLRAHGPQADDQLS